MRLELTRHCCHYPLKVACIPISPPAPIGCPEQDSNLHTSRHAHLKRTRLPIPPSGLCKKKQALDLLGAMNETRTRDPDLGKVVLYQLSYHRISRLLKNIFFSQNRLQRYSVLSASPNFSALFCKKVYNLQLISAEIFAGIGRLP